MEKINCLILWLGYRRNRKIVDIEIKKYLYPQKMKKNNVYRKTNKCAHQLALLVVFSDIKMNVHFNVTFLSMIQDSIDTNVN